MTVQYKHPIHPYTNGLRANTLGATPMALITCIHSKEGGHGQTSATALVAGLQVPATQSVHG